VLAHASGQITIALPPEHGIDQRKDTSADADSFAHFLIKLAEAFPGAAYLAGTHRLSGCDRRRMAQLAELAEHCGTPLVATNEVQYHDPARKPLHYILTCVREHVTIDNAGLQLKPHAE